MSARRARQLARQRNGYYRADATTVYGKCPLCRRDVHVTHLAWDTDVRSSDLLDDAVTDHLLDTHQEDT